MTSEKFSTIFIVHVSMIPRYIVYQTCFIYIKRFIIIGDITIGVCMVGVICVSGITLIKQTSDFVQRTRINVCFNSSFLDFGHA